MIDPGDSRAPTALSSHIAPEDLREAAAALGQEPQSCLLCGGDRFERLFRRDGKWFWSCASCELVFVHDIYPEFVQDTEPLQRIYAFDRREVASSGRIAKYDEFLSLLKPAQRPGRLLEVGCGQGLFLERARDRGWDVRGVEFLARVAAHAVLRGLEVFHGTLLDAWLEAACFDAVVMREVIVHIVDPVALLRESARILRPGGVAALGTGNARSWAARWRGGRWAYYRFGGHMHIRFYSPASAAALARAAGFDSVQCRTRGFAFLEAGEMRGRWYRPFLKVAQVPLSPLATAAGAGHRLVMLLRKGPASD
jgi:SAM-dependent methyltransferase